MDVFTWSGFQPMAERGPSVRKKHFLELITYALAR
jgi:hypothetical protein